MTLVAAVRLSPVPAALSDRMKTCAERSWFQTDIFLYRDRVDVPDRFMRQQSPFLQFREKVKAVETENEKGIVVDFFADLIYHRSKVLAGDCPVGETAGHAEVFPG